MVIIGSVTIFLYHYNNLFVSGTIIYSDISSTNDVVESYIIDNDIIENNLVDKKILTVRVRINNNSIATMNKLYITLDEPRNIEYEISATNIIDESVRIEPFQTFEKDVVYYVDETIDDEKLYSVIENGMSLEYDVYDINYKNFSVNLETQK